MRLLSSNGAFDEGLVAGRNFVTGTTLPLGETDFLGINTLYTWDTARRLKTGETRAAGRPEAQTVSTQWHPTWRLPTLVTEAGRTTAYTYDSLGNPLSETVTDTASSQVRVRQWTYTPQGLVASETAPNGAVTQYGYDSQGNLTSVTNPLGHVTTLQYDTAGRVTQSTEPNGLVSTYGYDARGRLLNHNRGGLLTSYTWRPSGQIASVSLPSGHAITYQYDAAQRLTGWSDNRGAQGLYTLDAMGNRTQEQIKDGTGNVVWQIARSINSLNRVASVTLGANQSTSYGYNANGDTTSDTNGLGQSTSYGLDGLKRLTAITNAANATAALSYNALDAVTGASDYKGAATSYTRDAFGGATQEASADSGTRATQYDSLGLPSQITDALGQATALQRDSLGRPTQLSFADGKTTVLRYDLSGGAYNAPGAPDASKGYLSEITDRSGTTAWQRDSQGRVTAKTQTLASGAVQTVSYSYNAAGLLDTLGYPSGGQLQHQYDSTGRLAQLNWNGVPLITGIAWTPLGQPKSWNWALSTTVAALRAYDSAGRVSATELSSYQYDAAGRITSLTQQLWQPSDSNPANSSISAISTPWSVGYDAAGRITAFGAGASFSYDANGNRLSSLHTTGAGTATQTLSRSYSIDPQGNRLLGLSQTSSGPTGSASTSLSYQYSANGELLGDGLRSYGYNAEGRLASVTTGNTSTAPTTRYAHNALGQRVFKTEPLYPPAGASEEDPGFWSGLWAFFRSLWSPATAPAEQLGWAYAYDEDGTLIGEYGAGGPASVGTSEHIWLATPSGPLPLVAIVNGQKYAVHADHLNTPRQLSNASGQPVWQWAYSAFGEEAPTQAAHRFADPDTNPGSTGAAPLSYHLRYPGQYADEESGLFYNYFRSYSPTSGRYTQADPVGLDGGWNRFTYVSSDPLGFLDPDGLQQTRAGRPLENQLLEGGGGGVGGPTVGGPSPFGLGGGARMPPNSALVCRGGACKAESFANGSGVSRAADGSLSGVSTQCKPGATVEELAGAFRHNQVGVTTVGNIRASGGRVTLDGTPGNPNHATVDGLTPVQLEQLFSPTIPNPVPPALRR